MSSIVNGPDKRSRDRPGPRPAAGMALFAARMAEAPTGDRAPGHIAVTQPRDRQ